jgi:CelD/BcsL family acetyltransferase involved in cellulose biosynthesis
VDAGLAGGTPVAFVHDGGRHTFLLPLVLRPVPGGGGLDATSPYGYPGLVGDAPLDDEAAWREAVASLQDCLRERAVLACFVRLHPLLPGRLDALARAGTVVQHGHTVSVDLTAPPDLTWARTRSNHRRNIEQARKSGLRVVMDDWSRLPEFVDAYHETMRRVGATESYFFPPAYFESLRKHVPGSLHLAVVDDGGILAGGGIFFEQGGIVQYHLGATRSTYLPRQPTKLLFDEVRLWAAGRGNQAFHLGGGVGGRVNPLFHFKAGFSDDRPPFFTWRLVPDPDAYVAVLKAAGRELPLDDSGWFPAYRGPGAAA